MRRKPDYAWSGYYHGLWGYPQKGNKSNRGWGWSICNQCNRWIWNHNLWKSDGFCKCGNQVWKEHRHQGNAAAGNGGGRPDPPPGLDADSINGLLKHVDVVLQASGQGSDQGRPELSGTGGDALADSVAAIAQWKAERERVKKDSITAVQVALREESRRWRTGAGIPGM